MNHTEFVFWLKGYLESRKKDNRLTESHLKTIKKYLVATTGQLFGDTEDEAKEEKVVDNTPETV
jgi:hypothetical protein